MYTAQLKVLCEYVCCYRAAMPAKQPYIQTFMLFWSYLLKNGQWKAEKDWKRHKKAPKILHEFDNTGTTLLQVQVDSIIIS